MSHAAEFNMSMNVGADFTKQFHLKTPGNTDITGYTITSKLKQHYTDTTSTSFTVTKTDASSGQFTISLTQAQTAALSAGTWVYDILSDDGSGTTTTLVRGKIDVLPGVSA